MSRTPPELPGDFWLVAFDDRTSQPALNATGLAYGVAGAALIDLLLLGNLDLRQERGGPNAAWHIHVNPSSPASTAAPNTSFESLREEYKDDELYNHHRQPTSEGFLDWAIKAVIKARHGSHAYVRAGVPGHDQPLTRWLLGRILVERHITELDQWLAFLTMEKSGYQDLVVTTLHQQDWFEVTRGRGRKAPPTYTLAPNCTDVAWRRVALANALCGGRVYGNAGLPALALGAMARATGLLGRVLEGNNPAEQRQGEFHVQQGLHDVAWPPLNAIIDAVSAKVRAYAVTPHSA